MRAATFWLMEFSNSLNKQTVPSSSARLNTTTHWRPTTTLRPTWPTSTPRTGPKLRWRRRTARGRVAWTRGSLTWAFSRPKTQMVGGSKTPSLSVCLKDPSIQWDMYLCQCVYNGLNLTVSITHSCHDTILTRNLVKNAQKATMRRISITVPTKVKTATS